MRAAVAQSGTFTGSGSPRQDFSQWGEEHHGVYLAQMPLTLHKPRFALCTGLWGRNCRIGAPHRDRRLAIAGAHPQRFQGIVDHLGKSEIRQSDAHAVGVHCACL